MPPGPGVIHQGSVCLECDAVLQVELKMFYIIFMLFRLKNEILTYSCTCQAMKPLINAGKNIFSHVIGKLLCRSRHI